MMRVTRTSVLTGKEHTMDLDITPQQYQQWLNGQLIQHAFPNLSADEREFLMTGTTAEEWDTAFGDKDEDGGEYPDVRERGYAEYDDIDYPVLTDLNDDAAF